MPDVGNRGRRNVWIHVVDGRIDVDVLFLLREVACHYACTWSCWNRALRDVSRISTPRLLECHSIAIRMMFAVEAVGSAWFEIPSTSLCWGALDPWH